MRTININQLECVSGGIRWQDSPLSSNIIDLTGQGLWTSKNGMCVPIGATPQYDPKNLIGGVGGVDGDG